MNKVIKFLIASDFVMYSGWGLWMPIFAIFIIENITFEDPARAVKVAGFSAFIYWVLKSLLQIPISRYFDKNKGEKDDYWAMVLGLFITSLIPFTFLFAKIPAHIYIIQIFHAFGMALFIPSWRAIFTRHIDKGREAFEWGMDSTFLGLGAGITGAIGGITAALFGFKIVFILVGIIYLFSVFLLLFIHDSIIPRQFSRKRIFSKLFSLIEKKRRI